MKHVVSVGGGFTSTIELPLYMRDVLKIPVEETSYVIACLANESDDVWRMVSELEQRTGKQVVRIAYSKTDERKYVVNPRPEEYPSIWDIFDEVKMLGNSRLDPCSRVLKRETISRYLHDNFIPALTTLYVGISADEIDRTLAIQKNWTAQGFHVSFPLAEVPQEKSTQERCLEVLGWVPQAYAMGFKHNNCNKFCVKAGLKEMARLLFYDRETYLQAEQKEKLIREKHGIPWTILRRRRTIDGIYTVTSLTLEQYRIEIETDPKFEFEALPEAASCYFCDSL